MAKQKKKSKKTKQLPIQDQLAKREPWVSEAYAVVGGGYKDVDDFTLEEIAKYKKQLSDVLAQFQATEATMAAAKESTFTGFGRKKLVESIQSLKRAAMVFRECQRLKNDSVD